MSAFLRNIRLTLEMIKIEHTLFALPFAFLGAVLAARGLPSALQLGWITLAMVGARSTAMAFNRIADREYDARNPRTRPRAIPAGLLSVGFVWAFTVLSATLFFVAASMLNRLTLVLAPVALASITLYSFTKLWTLLWHRTVALDRARVARGSIRSVGGAILDHSPRFARSGRRFGHGSFARLSAHACARRRSEPIECGVLYYECYGQRDPPGDVWRGS